MRKVENLNSIYLASIPALGIYYLPNGMGLNWLLVGILFLINLIYGNFQKSISSRKNEIKWFTAVFFIGMMGLVINNDNYYNFTLFWHNLLAIILFFVSIVFFTNSYNISVFKKTLYILGVLAAGICLYQRTMLLLTGSCNNDFFIPGLEINRDLSTISVNRVSAYFTEPAHASIFLLPIYYVALNNKRYFLSIIFMVGILFSGSTTGFLLLVVLSVVYMNKNHMRKKSLFFLLLLIIAGYGIIILYFPDVLIDNIEKLNNTDTSATRFLGPISYLSFFDLLQWIFGVGFNQLEGFLKTNGVMLLSKWDTEINSNFANAFLYMLISYGILGLYFFLKYLVRTIKNNESDLGFVVYAIGICASDQIFFNRNLLYVLTFLLFSRHLIISQKS